MEGFECSSVYVEVHSGTKFGLDCSSEWGFFSSRVSGQIIRVRGLLIL